MKLNYILISIACLLASGCATKSPLTIDDLFSKTVDAKTVQLDIESDSILLPIWALFTVDKYLITYTNGHEKHIYVYDTEKKEPAFGLINVGRGPNEITQGALSINQTKTGVSIKNAIDESLIIMDSIYENGHHNPVKTDMSKSNDQPIDLLLLNNNTIVATGLFKDSDKQFALYNGKFETLDYFDTYPEVEGEADIDSEKKAFAFQGNLTSISDTKFAHFTSAGSNTIKFFDCNGSSVEKLNEYIFRVPIFEPLTLGAYTILAEAPQDDKTLGNLSTTASDDEYFTLVGTKPASDQRCMRSNAVYCFDQKGNPTRKIVLDREVEQITYSMKFNKLYASGTEEGMPYFYEVLL